MSVRRGGMVVAGVAAFLLVLGLVILEKRRQGREPAGPFLERPRAFVKDVDASEAAYDIANPSVKKAFLKGLKERDWAKVRSALAPGFVGRFPAVGAGRIVPDPSVGIREIGNENLPDLGADAFVQVLRAHVEPWSVVERTMWRPWEFLLDPDGKSAFVSLHFEVGGRRPDGARSDLYGTLRGRLVSADGKSWQIHRLEWIEGTRVDATRGPWEDITDATGLHFNESEAAHKLRQSMVNDRGVTNSGGLVVTDWNGDGFPDILANVQGGLVALFVNDGKGGFVRGKTPDIAPDEVGYAYLSVDLDGDGVEELVSGQITTAEGGKASAPVYRRRGDGWECLPHALEMDVPESLHDINVMGVVPGDFDEDGDLDLVYCCYSSRDSKLFQFNRVESYDGADNYLFVNQGGLRFTEESDKRGITGTQYTYVAKWWDFDFDGDLDLFEGNDYGPNHLWVNDGKGQFKDAKDHIFDADTNYTMGVTLADWENDGVWGMYISNMYSHAGNRVFLLAGGITESMRRLGLLLAQGNQFYECDPKTRQWRETSVARKVNWADWAWGCVFFDIDNDMDKDLFVANGYTTNTDPNAPDY
ncbi:MAG: VCBS repeat-containing protein [Planctomycetes bacterium]|nr:VCBS repeat-containing protein [Planctomycetota bacterium]